MHLPQTAGLAINSLLFVIEFGAGILSDSSALLADSLDMLGDALVYGVSLFVVGRSLVWCTRAALLKGLVMAFSAALFLAACNPSAGDSTAYDSVETITAGPTRGWPRFRLRGPGRQMARVS